MTTVTESARPRKEGHGVDVVEVVAVAEAEVGVRGPAPRGEVPPCRPERQVHAPVTQGGAPGGDPGEEPLVAAPALGEREGFLPHRGLEHYRVGEVPREVRAVPSVPYTQELVPTVPE